jgi:hypothetical protein
LQVYALQYRDIEAALYEALGQAGGLQNGPSPVFFPLSQRQRE